jgi:hypothetical protein
MIVNASLNLFLVDRVVAIGRTIPEEALTNPASYDSAARHTNRA